ncbi:MAG: hypothetical protein L6R39_005122 [Caloplaca ligustica]|nr:MAG: hypothetical protein L6R39_005122 [Caloplaca ligustica]
MSASSDPDRFFQTRLTTRNSHSLAEVERKFQKSKNKNGNPIRLPSKILAAIAHPSCTGDVVFLAESAGNVRRVAVDVNHRQTDEKDIIYRGPTAPVTSVAISPDGQQLLAAAWDKTIWSWSLSSRQPLLRYRGHTDFVKCIITLRLDAKDIVVSGGADASIIVWSMGTGQKIHVLKGHTRGILDLALDPMTYHYEQRAKDAIEEVIVFSAGSDREIRRWRIGLGTAEQLDAETPILAHETSVCALRFDADGDLWTASADGTTRCLSRSRQFQPDTTIPHGDYVRAVALDEVGGYVVTGGRSEDVKVWDRGTGDLVHVFDGHFDEITGLVMFDQRCVSVGIDGTVRTWSLKAGDLRTARRKHKEDQQALAAGESVADNQPSVISTAGGLTEEEERELADLMQEDE